MDDGGVEHPKKTYCYCFQSILGGSFETAIRAMHCDDAELRNQHRRYVLEGCIVVKHQLDLVQAREK